MNRAAHHRRDNFLELWIGNWFCEDVCKHLIDGDIFHQSTLMRISHKVEANIQMFSPAGGAGRSCNENACLIVFTDGCSIMLRVTQLTEHLSQEHRLLHSKAESLVFCLSGGQCDKWLQTGARAHSAPTQEEDVATCCTASTGIGGRVVGITESM